MREHTRRAVAYIAGCRIVGIQASAVYDYSAGRHFGFSGNVAGDGVSIYDYTARCHVGGSGQRTLCLYHYGNARHLSLEVDGHAFRGYDYDSNQHFSGTVNSRSVSLYDYENGRYYSFSVS